MLKSTHLSSFFAAIFLSFIAVRTVAKEGMWIPKTLKTHKHNMHKMGLRMPIDMIYNEHGTGLNNAVVLFGGNCTAEVISPQGLLLTNHHCAFRAVQKLSTDEHNFFQNGFWARNLKEELPCKGLSVTFVRVMDDVTDTILAGIPDTLADNIRDNIIALRIDKLEKQYKAKTGLNATIAPYYNGNEYWISLTETFTDIRLTAFPPDDIGYFGGETEDWEWPRHTADFSMFRIYAGKDNKPAPYSADNKPYNTTAFFKININGYKEGDFAMAYGFPGSTQEYLSSGELNQKVNITEATAVEIRSHILDVWGANIKDAPMLSVKYAGKYNGLKGGLKKYRGEVEGIKAINVIDIKRTYEQAFQKWADNDTLQPFAKHLLNDFNYISFQSDSFVSVAAYTNEVLKGVEILQLGGTMQNMIGCFRDHLTTNELRDTLDKIMENTASFYKNFDAGLDSDVFMSVLPVVYSHIDKQGTINNKTALFTKVAAGLYDSSIFKNLVFLRAFTLTATMADSSKLLQDPLWRCYTGFTQLRDQFMSAANTYADALRYLNRLYMRARMIKDKDTPLYPDANLTLRVSYGNIEPLGTDSSHTYQTNLDGLMTLNGKSNDFKVPEKLSELYRTKDYGRWDVNGTVPLAFLATCQTTGGNSGSPVINKRGELIGTNFDRPYESTMSDHYFDNDRCRNISLDIRFTLFILEKYGAGGWLLDEMKLVKR